MKLYNKRDFLTWIKFTSILILTLFIFVAGGCGDDDDDNGPEPPEITGLNPNSGLVGSTISIVGFNFGTRESTTVTFGSELADIASINATLISVTVPNGLSAGTITITVNVNDQSDTAQFTVTEIPVPTIDSIEPSEGLPGTSITITGTNFSDENSENTVIIAGENATITSASTTEIEAIVPDSLEAGNVQVSVEVNERTSNLGIFTVLAPEITSISPGRGTIGTTVRIEGANFSDEPNGNTVIFGDMEATITSESATVIETSVPQGIPASILSVRVVVNGTPSNALQFDVEGPSITSISPGFGPVGSEVIITGTNFSDQTANISVRFGDEEADILDATPTSITVEVPDLPLGTVNITATVNGLVAAGAATTFEILIPTPPLYWLEQASGGPFQVVEGINGTTAVLREANSIPALAVDSEAGEVYWVEDQGSAFNPSSTLRNTNGEIFTTQNRIVITSIAIDTQNDNIYWLQRNRSVSGVTDWEVFMSDLMGNNPSELFDGKDLQILSALELDVDNNTLYFIENFSDGPINGNSRIFQGSMAGDTATLSILYDEINNLNSLSDVQDFFDIAVSGSSIYIAGAAPSTTTSEILRGNLDGSSATLSMVYESEPGSNDNPMSGILGLTIDREFDYLYWINYGDGATFSTTGTIFRGPINGSAEPEEIFNGLNLRDRANPVKNGRRKSEPQNFNVGFTF